MYKLLNFYNQNMFKQLENWVYFAVWLWKSLSFNAIDYYITIKIYVNILSRSDISSNQCKFMFAILLQLLLLFCANVNLLMLSVLWI